jgi:FixJ family two-component response regulator
VPKNLEIAVVDDDDSFRVALVESFCSLGYGANGYASAGDYIAAANSSSYDCVVSDIQMPVMSGFGLLEWIISQQPGIPVILITARTDPQLEVRAAVGRAACLLRKPFEIGELVECIERATRP